MQHNEVEDRGMMGGMSLMHWAIVAGVVALLFGKGMVSRLAADLGGAVRELKRAGRELTETKDETEATVRQITHEVKKELEL